MVVWVLNTEKAEWRRWWPLDELLGLRIVKTHSSYHPVPFSFFPCGLALLAATQRGQD